MFAEEVEKKILIEIEKLLGQVDPEQRIYLLKTLLERNKISKGVFSSIETNLGMFSAPLIDDDVDNTITTSGVPIDDALGWMDEAGALMRIFCEDDEMQHHRALRMLANDEYKETVVYYGFQIDDEMRAKMSAETLEKLRSLGLILYDGLEV
jgi:hypothetical protein